MADESLRRFGASKCSNAVAILLYYCTYCDEYMVLSSVATGKCTPICYNVLVPLIKCSAARTRRKKPVEASTGYRQAPSTGTHR